MKYETVIGIETHVQLKTKSKLFCGCDNDAREAEPNTKVCPVCLGLPGTLPVLNGEAVRLALRAGLALNGEVAKHTKFDRKNYFYPDLPKGYQISQFDKPIIGQGEVVVPTAEGEFKVGITRAHMEEDAGKLTHPTGADYSLVDLNRAGTPLLEIVSEPDMRSAAQAKAYAQEIYTLMRYADVSEANLYYGNMRFDVNISIRPVGSREFGTRAEIKNLNSFRAVERAVEYEVERQAALLDEGKKVIQETRGWDDAAGKTYSQRSKEEAHDYRYFPEPDLPPLLITEDMIEAAKKSFPAKSRPAHAREVMRKLGLDHKTAEVLVAEPDLTKLYLTVAEGEHSKHHKRIANWLTGEVLRGRSEGNGFDLPAAKDWIELSVMVEDGKLSATAAKTVLGEMMRTGQGAELIAARLQLIQVSDSGEIEAMVNDVVAANPQAVADFRAGKQQALGALVGQVMKASRGQANPKLVNELLLKALEE